MKTRLRLYSVKEFRKHIREFDIEYSIYKTLYGITLVATIDCHVCAVVFGANKKEALSELSAMFPNTRYIEKELPLHNNVLTIINGEYRMNDEPVPLLLCGTVFQLKVWEALLSVPKNKTTTYAEIAKKIKAPKSVRAVGSAVGKNKIGFLVPCHKVVRSNGEIGGYRWGIAVKEKLLKK